MRALVASCVLVVFGLGVVVADDFFCQITKIETKDGKTTISGKKGKKDEAKDFGPLVVAKDVKVAKGKFDMETKKFAAGDAIEGGLKSDAFKDASTEKPVFAYVTTDTKDTITQVLSVGFGKGKGKKKDTN